MNTNLRVPGLVLAMLVVLTFLSELASAGTANPDGTVNAFIDIGDVTFLVLISISIAAAIGGFLTAKENSWLIFFGFISGLIIFVTLPALIDFNTTVITAGINELTGQGTGTIFGIGALIFTISVIVGIGVIAFNLLTTGDDGVVRSFK